MNNSTKLYAGGLAETVPTPTLFTFSYLSHWFSTAHSLGKALDILHLPYSSSTDSVLILHNNQAFIDLDKEEKSIYKPTLFSYSPYSTSNQTPQLTINYKKLLNLKNLHNTLQITLTQSQWIAKPQETIQAVQSKLEQLPTLHAFDSLQDIDNKLTNEVWPVVLAIGMLAEFYAQFLHTFKLSTLELQQINQYISYQANPHDWLMNSIHQMYDVKTGTLSLEDYLKEYGLRADQDYEFAQPRWYETPEKLKLLIEKSIKPIQPDTKEITIPNKLNPYVQALIILQQLRSLGRKKLLPYVDYIRQAARNKFGNTCDFNTITRESLLFDTPVTKPNQTSASTQIEQFSLNHNIGLPVSPGKTTGTTLQVHSATDDIPPNTIAIFPNSSPEYTLQFPHCTGIIFLIGGQTSHGAIVAREYKIPALVDPKAKAIPSGAKIEINGLTGEWKLL